MHGVGLDKWETLRREVLANGIIDEANVKKLRNVLYADGKITREEADFLFTLNDITCDVEGHHPSWTDLFVESLTDFVLRDEDSPGYLDPAEATYLIQKIGADGVVDDNEVKLLINTTLKAEGEAPVPFSNFVLDAVKRHILADGIVDFDEVGYLRMIMYGEGGLKGSKITRREADFLFAINNATTHNEGHDPAWQEFFVEGIASCVLEDEESEGVVDEDEARWLTTQITADDELDSNEQALLAFLKSKVDLSQTPLAALAELVQD